MNELLSDVNGASKINKRLAPCSAYGTDPEILLFN